jgi:hypothetical protein
MRKALALAVTILACKSRVDVRADPVDAARDAAQPPTHSVIVRGGEAIDLGGVVTRVLTDKPPIAEVHDERRAFLFGRDFVLRAFDLTSGKQIWSRTISPTLRPLLIDRQFVYVVGDSVITAFAKDNGDARTMTLSRPLRHAAAANDLVFVAREDRALEIIDPSSGVRIGAATLPFDPIGFRSGLQKLADGRTVCAIAADSALQVACFDEKGTSTARVTVGLSKPPLPAGTVFGIVSFDERYVLYGAHSGVRRSAVVRLADGSVIATVAERASAIVEREDGSIAGLLVLEPALRLLDLAGKVIWTTKSISIHHDGAAAVARGDTVFIDMFPQFSSGSALEARNLTTGALVWKGVVEQLPIGHSEYFNEVRISFAGDRLLLRGDESAIITTQLFDPYTGERLFAASHHR